MDDVDVLFRSPSSPALISLSSSSSARQRRGYSHINHDLDGDSLGDWQAGYIPDSSTEEDELHALRFRGGGGAGGARRGRLPRPQGQPTDPASDNTATVLQIKEGSGTASTPLLHPAMSKSSLDAVAASPLATASPLMPPARPQLRARSLSDASDRTVVPRRSTGTNTGGSSARKNQQQQHLQRRVASDRNDRHSLFSSAGPSLGATTGWSRIARAGLRDSHRPTVAGDASPSGSRTPSSSSRGSGGGGALLSEVSHGHKGGRAERAPLSPRALQALLVTLQLLSLVPAAIGVLYSVFRAVLDPGTPSPVHTSTASRRVEWLLGGMWAGLSGHYCHAMARGLTRRWLVYYPLPAAVIRLVRPPFLRLTRPRQADHARVKTSSCLAFPPADLAPGHLLAPNQIHSRLLLRKGGPLPPRVDGVRTDGRHQPHDPDLVRAAPLPNTNSHLALAPR